jgi:hAT family C-terminal dimerisation region
VLVQDTASASTTAQDRNIAAPFISELNGFRSCEPDANQTAVEFWKQRCTDFPYLSEMAKIYLAISPGSVPVECMFSSGGVMLNSKRSSMAPFKADMVLFIHDNYDTVCK